MNQMYVHGNSKLMMPLHGLSCRPANVSEV